MILALKVLTKGFLFVNGEQITPQYPEGAIGICMVFKTKKAARKFSGKDTNFIKISPVKKAEGTP